MLFVVVYYVDIVVDLFVGCFNVRWLHVVAVSCISVVLPFLCFVVHVCYCCSFMGRSWISWCCIVDWSLQLCSFPGPCRMSECHLDIIIAIITSLSINCYSQFYTTISNTYHTHTHTNHNTNNCYDYCDYV